jgi:pseudomonalisin
LGCAGKCALLGLSLLGVTNIPIESEVCVLPHFRAFRSVLSLLIRPTRRRVVEALTLCFLLLATMALRAQSPEIVIRPSHQVVDDGDRVVLPGNVHRLAISANRIGRSSANLPMEQIILVLKRRPGGDEELDKLISNQHDPTSPLFHQWLSPEEFGRRFGISDSDLDSIIEWLQSYGFRIDEVAPGRGSINFSGNAGQVERAFQTEINDYELEGKIHHGNGKGLTIPRALADVVHGVFSLHDFPNRSAIGRAFDQKKDQVVPDFIVGQGVRAMVPGDFATIYNVKPLYNNGIDGAGLTIAVASQSNININDVRKFRSTFGLPARDPVITVVNKNDPGVTDAEFETDLDVEWSGAVAKNATINLVVTKSTIATYGYVLSSQYIVTNKVAPIVSLSFGECENTEAIEAAPPPIAGSRPQFFYGLWSQAVAQGLTVVAASADSGAAGCDGQNDTVGTHGLGVITECSTPYNVCVGGTEFNDTSNPGQYWSSKPNNDQSTAVSYIPEVAWNESGANGGTGLHATGGGKSVWPKPSWQVPPFVPADGFRDVPDVALNAAQHDGYVVIYGGITILWSTQNQQTTLTGGNSAAAPSFAGLMALVEQKNGQWQGNANMVLYPMGQSQYGFGFPQVFHDITTGNNSVPGVPGYTAKVGYDQVTGLGSVDANALVNDWGAPAISIFTVSPSTVVAGQPFSISAAIGNHGGSSLSSFQVWRAPDSAGVPGTWTQVNSLALSGNPPSNVSLNDTPPAPGTVPIYATPPVLVWLSRRRLRYRLRRLLRLVLPSLQTQAARPWPRARVPHSH